MEGKFFLLIWVMLLLAQLHGYKSCVEKERKALLELKKYIISITEEVESDSVLPTWTYNTESDCCRWEGVKCNRTSKRVTEIAFGTLNLKKNSLLNLSLLHPFEDVRSLSLSPNDFHNQFSGLFDDIEGYNSLRRLRNLEILDLSSNRFSNSIFPFINSATSLKTLFLGHNNFDDHLPVKELKDLINLEKLDLSRNEFGGALPVQELSSLRKLKSLNLSYNSFYAPMGSQGYKSLGRLRNLEILDLQINNLDDNIFPFLSAARSLKTLFLRLNNLDCPFPAKELKVLTNLELLDLCENKFNCPIPIRGICEMKNIQELDLSGNKLVGQFPLCLTSLSGLRVLDLSSNQMTGNVPFSFSNLESLKYLSLVENNFEGIFSLGSLANLSELRVFKLGSKSKSLQVESESSWKPKFQMSVIELSSCNLVKVPHFLLHQNDLSHVDLSDNKISGFFPQWLLENNTKLEVLFLQQNSFTRFLLPKSAHKLPLLDVSFNEFNHLFPENISWAFPHLMYMKLAHNGFQGNLLSFLGDMKNIMFLDISHNSFHGEVSGRFFKGCYSMLFLTLSHNKLSGEVFPESVKFTPLKELSMDNANMLEGEIPIIFNMSSLQLLDLSTNMLEGGIPSHINSRSPVILLLQNNNLSGEIPDTLLAPKTPIFILLRGNRIQLLDLANNRLNGSIPTCFSNKYFSYGGYDTLNDYEYGSSSAGSFFFSYFSPQKDFGVKQMYGIYFKSLIVLSPFILRSEPTILIKIQFATKHRYDSYMGGNLQLLFGMDLAENELSGEIPVELGGLLEIQGLNLSHNNLTGMIPESFSGLKNIESLDLSFNRLQGRIPQELTELSSLAVFNVSFNNLSGVIPQGKQFNTFETNSFLGNPLLCGQQINRSCYNSNFQVPDNEGKDDESQIDMVSFYWSSAAAYVTVLIGLLASLSFDSPWSRFWFYIVEVFIYKAKKNLLW
ncbi:hypothetical protein Bca52824_083076 [Brassica carinata]|uniref:Leucine-rich repeat-containing N-terminal plant-type domain-containing protein n=1 Tax=Brassica carinata TaxID=52824 RepID=A0A8X7PKP6_BRACI|nr:hypothetical protein Bca52824_083076 [Brassica carinata]